eukprot:7076488-Pyramimonas_sp.AAC.1
MAAGAGGVPLLPDLTRLCSEGAAASPRNAEALLELCQMRPCNIVAGEGSAINQLWRLAGTPD